MGNQMDLRRRGDPPGRGQGRGTRHALVRQPRRWPNTSSGSASRSIRAPTPFRCSTRQHHVSATTAKVARVGPRRERLAVHARHLAVEPGVRLLRRHRRPLLRRSGQAHPPTLAGHGYRTVGLGTPVLTGAGWYKLNRHATVAVQGGRHSAQTHPRHGAAARAPVGVHGGRGDPAGVAGLWACRPCTGIAVCSSCGRRV